MKIRKLLELQSVITERATPCDMNVNDLNQHWSESKEGWIDILDMDLTHLIRSYSKSLNKKTERDMDISSLKTQLRNIQEELNVLVDKS